MNIIYTYIPIEKILNNIKHLKDFGLYDFIILIIIIFLYIVILLYILPILYSLKETYIKLQEKKKKKLMLKKIITQKELEDEILKEIKSKNKFK